MRGARFSRSGHLGESDAPLVDASPEEVDVGDCKSLLTHIRNRDAIAEEAPARHFSGIRQSLGSGELGNVSRLPVVGNVFG